MLKIFKNLKPLEWLFIAVSTCFIVLQVYLDLKLPEYTKEMTILLSTGGAMSEILKNGGFMMLCAFGSLFAAITVGFFAAQTASRLSMRLRGNVFDKVMSFSMEEIGGFSTSSLITRSTNDISQVQMTVAMGLQLIIKAPITAVWAIAKISNKSWQWTLSTGVAVGITASVLLLMIIFVLPMFKKVQRLTDDTNRVARENLTGIRVVRAYNAEEYQQSKFDVVNKELTKTQLFINRIMAFMMPMLSLVMGGLTLSIYWIGAHLVNSASFIQKVDVFSDMMIFSSYAMQILMAFMMLIMISVMLPRASVSAKRINEVLDKKPSIHDGTETQISDNISTIEFKNVGFKYPGAGDYVLKDINFTAKRGEKIAFIGSTGSGKSTIINLIPRFYDVTEGQIMIDRVDIKDYTLNALRDKIGYVSQNAVIFKGTAASNIAYGDNGKETAGLEQIEEAAKIAKAYEFILEKDNGFDTEISQGGTNLSGGQKQRVSIARAICRNPEIFIFDDSFSALDYKTDRDLRSALKDKTKNAISFIVAQRIGTIRDADKIIVLDEGRIEAIGTHEELLDTSKVYKEIALSQLSQKELL